MNVYVFTTMANWTDVMYPLWDATTFFVAIYFVTLIVIAAFFAMNIALVRVAAALLCDGVA